jgi:hypothetical protein
MLNLHLHADEYTDATIKPDDTKKPHHTRSNTNSIPDSFLCPLSYLIMVDPVIAEDGHTYEREVIMRWLTNHSGYSPITRQKIGTTFTSNVAVKQKILAYLGVTIFTPTDDEEYHDFDPEKRIQLFLSNDIFIQTKTLVEFQAAIYAKDLQTVRNMIALDPRLVYATPHELALTVNEFIKDLRPIGRSDDDEEDEVDEHTKRVDAQFLDSPLTPKPGNPFTETISAIFNTFFTSEEQKSNFFYYRNGYDVCSRVGTIDMIEEMYNIMHMYKPQMTRQIRLEQRNLYRMEEGNSSPQSDDAKIVKVVNRKVVNRELWRTLRNKQTVQEKLTSRVQQLIEFGAQVNVHGKKVGKKSNALYLCLKYQPDDVAAEVLPILFEADPNILHCKCSPAEYPLYSAAKYGRVQCIRTIVEQFNMRDFASHTSIHLYCQNALHCAAESGDEATLRYIISLDCLSVDCLDSRLQSPLFLAACKNQFMVVKILVAHGANLDLQNVVGNTALHVAVSHGYSAVIEHLIRNGADVNLLNKRNLRPVQMTTASTTIELVNYLTQRQVSIAMSRLRQLQASKDQMENELLELKSDHESLKQVVVEKDVVIETLKKQQEEMQKQIQTIMSLLKPEIV